MHFWKLVLWKIGILNHHCYFHCCIQQDGISGIPFLLNLIYPICLIDWTSLYIIITVICSTTWHKPWITGWFRSVIGTRRNRRRASRLCGRHICSDTLRLPTLTKVTEKYLQHLVESIARRIKVALKGSGLSDLHWIYVVLKGQSFSSLSDLRS